MRISAVSILKYQRKILANKALPEDIEKLLDMCNSLEDQLERLKSYYDKVEIRDILSRMTSYVDSLKLTIGKASLFHRERIGLTSIGDLAGKILDTFFEFQDYQNVRSEMIEKQIYMIVHETKQNMLTILIVILLAIILLGMMVPGKIALPFKKIKDAIRELQECNFEVSIYYNQDDEIGEIAREMNKMIASMKHFEELRADRIAVESRKFDALANMVKRNVLVANSKGQLIYMNNRLYSLLKLESADVIEKSMGDTLIPPSIRQAYELAIKRRSKVENAQIVIPCKKNDSDDSDASAVGEDVFQGYANVLPIRGKDSSLDYYVMVLSEDIFS